MTSMLCLISCFVKNDDLIKLNETFALMNFGHVLNVEYSDEKRYLMKLFFLLALLVGCAHVDTEVDNSRALDPIERATNRSPRGL